MEQERLNNETENVINPYEPVVDESLLSYSNDGNDPDAANVSSHQHGKKQNSLNPSF